MVGLNPPDCIGGVTDVGRPVQTESATVRAGITVTGCVANVGADGDTTVGAVTLDVDTRLTDVSEVLDLTTSETTVATTTT